MEHGLDSDSSQSEDEGNGTLDTFDEIVEQSDLNKFSETLKKAQMVALEVERAQGTLVLVMGLHTRVGTWVWVGRVWARVPYLVPT